MRVEPGVEDRDLDVAAALAGRRLGQVGRCARGRDAAAPAADVARAVDSAAADVAGAVDTAAADIAGAVDALEQPVLADRRDPLVVALGAAFANPAQYLVQRDALVVAGGSLRVDDADQRQAKPRVGLVDPRVDDQVGQFGQFAEDEILVGDRDDQLVGDEAVARAAYRHSQCLHEWRSGISD